MDRQGGTLSPTAVPRTGVLLAGRKDGYDEKTRCTDRPHPAGSVGPSGLQRGGEEAEREGADAPANDAAQAAEEVVVGGFTVEGPNGQEIAVPETTVDQAAAEDYAESLRPIVEETAGGLSQAINPSAELENQTLSLSIEVEAAEQARAAAQEGLEDLRQIQPPEELEPIHERLVNAYEQALPTYENIIWAFGSEDADTLTAAAREGLPEIERLIVEARTILRDLERVFNSSPRILLPQTVVPAPTLSVRR